MEALDAGSTNSDPRKAGPFGTAHICRILGLSVVLLALTTYSTDERGAQARSSGAALEALSLAEVITSRQRNAIATAFRAPSSSSSSPLPVAPPSSLRGTHARARRLVDSLHVAGLLEPGGFERPRWHSFDTVATMPDVDTNDPRRFVIAIDPGHGGSDPGAEGPNGLLEKHLTIDIAQRVRLFLSEIDDVDIVLTRESDHGLSRGARVAAIRESEADLFVSLHFNHLPQSELTLVESYYAAPENIAESRAHQRQQHLARGHTLRAAINGPSDISFTRGSERFAQLVQQRIYDEVRRNNPGAENAGVKQDTLFVLTRSHASGALVELTCLSNAEEAERLTDEAYRDRLAAALADAVRDYLRMDAERPLDGTGV